MRRRSVVWGAVLATLAACGDGDDARRTDAGAGAGTADADEYDAEPFASTHELTAKALRALTRVGGDGTLHFAGAPEQVMALQPMQVLLSGRSAAAPHGLLKLVTAVQSESDGTAVSTVDAPIQLAFRKLHVRLSRSTSAEGARIDFGAPSGVAALAQPLWASEKVDDYAFNGDGDPETPLDQVHFHGALAGGFDYHFGLDVDWGDVDEIPGKVLDCLEEWVSGSFDCSVDAFIPEAKVGFGFKAGAVADLALDGVAFLEYSTERVLAEADLEPIEIGPLVFIPTVEVRAGFSGAASSQFAIASHAQATAEAEVSYSSKHGRTYTPPDVTYGFSAPKVVATLSAQSKVRVGPRLHLRLYKIVGPYASLYAAAELTADQLAQPCHRLYGGIEGDIGFSIISPDLPVVGHVSLADFSETFGVTKEEIASGACEAPAGGDPAAATAGAASSQAFAMPSFTPWARSYAATVDGFPYEGLGAQLEWADVTPTIDGRFLVTGSDVHTLQKLEPGGEVVWAKRYSVSDVDFFTDTLMNDLLVTRALPLADTRTLVLAHPYTLLWLDAAGNVMDNLRFEVPYRETWLRFTDVVSDGKGGYFVSGTYGDDPLSPLQCDGWLLHLDAQGKLLWSQTFGEPGTGEMLRKLVVLPDGVVALGERYNPADVSWRGLALRVSTDGALQWAQQLVADDCGGGYEKDLHLTTGYLSADGDVMAGGGIDYSGYAAAVLKLKPADGKLAFYSSTVAGDGAHLGPWLTALVPLPGSGMLAAGVYSGAQTRADIWLAGLDSVGKAQWMKRYGAADADLDLMLQADAYPQLLLTRDGGALVVAYSEGLGEPDSLWAMKVAAKDGIIDFAAQSGAERGDVSYAAGDACIVATPLSWAPSMRPVTQSRWDVLTQTPTVTSSAL